MMDDTYDVLDDWKHTESVAMCIVIEDMKCGRRDSARLLRSKRAKLVLNFRDVLPVPLPSPRIVARHPYL